MTRRELITSDEYIIANLKGIVIEGASNEKIISDLLEFMSSLRNELLKTETSRTIDFNIRAKYKKWCKDTKRSGGILVHGSIQEFFDYLEKNK